MALERQSHDRADRFARGERGLSTGIIAAPAASFREPASVGHLLPWAMREDLEQAFDADFGAVRIHRDAAAAGAASLLGALAFASGSAIYFGRGQYDPASLAGRKLISHELTHVLQQTARRSAGRHRLAATNAVGRGQVQCEPDPAAQQTEANQTKAFDLLAKNHRRGEEFSVDKHLEDTIALAKSLSGGRLQLNSTKPAFALPVAQAARGGKFAEFTSAAAKSFLFDYLKFHGFYDEAAGLLTGDDDFAMRTDVIIPRFAAFLESDKSFGRAWLERSLQRKAFAAIWPESVLRGWRDFYLRPTAVTPFDEKLKLVLQKVWTEYKADQGKVPIAMRTEAYWLTWRLLEVIEAERIDEQFKLRKTFVEGLKNQDLNSYFRHFASKLPKLKEEALKAGENLEKPAAARLAEGKIPWIEEAITYWTGVLSNFAKWEATWTLKDTQAMDAQAGLKPAKHAIPFAEPLREHFSAAVTGLFEPRKDANGDWRLPTPIEYFQDLQRFGNALTKDVLPALAQSKDAKTWLDDLLKQVLAEAERKSPDPEKLAEISILPMVFGRVLLAAGDYGSSADLAAVHFDDRLRAHRLDMARRIAAVAHWLGWLKIIEPLQPTFLVEESVGADQAGEPKLLLISDWEPDKDQQIAQMLVDFEQDADKSMLLDVPFSIRTIVQWFRYDYHRRVRIALDNLLRAETQLSAQTKLDFGELEHVRQTQKEVRKAMAESAEAEIAIEKVDAFPLKVPQRFIVRHADLIAPAGPEDINWYELIESHQKTQKQLLRRASGYILPTRLGQGVFAWLLPPLDGLYATMKMIPSLKQLIARRQGESEEQWRERLAPAASPKEAAEQGLISPEEFNQINEALLKWLAVVGEQEEKKIPPLWRRLIILRRRHLAMQLIPLIEDLAANPYISHGGGGAAKAAARIETPTLIITALRSFEGIARPLRESKVVQTEQEAEAERQRISLSVDVQAALLTFILAPSLLKLERSKLDWDTKRHIYEYFQLAIDFSENAAKLKALQAGLGTVDEAAPLVMQDARRAALVKAMRQFMEEFEAEVARAQTQNGIRSNDGKNLLPNTSKFQMEIKPGEEWRTNQGLAPDGKLDPNSGDEWELVAVHTAFEYYPGIGSEPVKGMRKGTGGPIAPARVVIKQAGKVTEYLAPNLPADISLFDYSLNGKKFTVYANNVDELNRLSDIIMWRAIQLSFKNSAMVFETIVDWMKTIGSIFFPEIAIADFIVTVAEMLDSGELRDIIGELSEDPHKFIKHVEEKLQGLLQPSRIWEFVMLGKQYSASPFSALAERKGEKPRRSRPEGKLGKIIAALRKLGRKFADALDGIRIRTQPPFRRVQGKIAMRPTLAWFLRKASRMIGAAADLIPPDATGGGMADQIKEAIDPKDEEEKFNKRVVEMLEGIRKFELPDELVDLTPAIELIIGFIVRKFGARGKIAYAILSTMPVPDSWAKHGKGGGSYTTALTMISSFIHDEWIKGGPADLNTYWKKLHPKISDNFNLIRQDFVDGIYALLNQTLKSFGLPAIAGPPESELPKTEISTTPLDETEASIPAGQAPGPGRPVLRQGSGVPLSRPSRTKFERHLGADLSHVRIHSNAASATQPIGASAVTSGSHVYLRPGINPGLPAGQRLLAHELTHVVQQTGSRGPSPGARSPTLGRPNVGLRFDAQRERAADEVASHVSRGASVPSSLRSQLGRAHGIQPSLDQDVATSILSELTTASAKSFTTGLVGGKDPEGWADANAIANQVLTMLESDKAEYARFMEDSVGSIQIRPLIHAHLTNRMKDMSKRDFELERKRIAQLAQKPRHPRKKDEPKTELDHSGFVQLLANYLFATTDVAMKFKYIESTKKVQKIELFGLNMAAVGGTSPLWAPLMESSFKGTKVKELKNPQHEVRQLLRNWGPKASIWHPTKYKFSDSLVTDLLSMIDVRATGGQTSVPKVSDYIKVASPHGHGLAIGTHGELTKGPRKIGSFKRQSHHTTQYLLAEYFSGSNPKAKAFPGSKSQLDSTYGPANISFTGEGLVDQIKGVGSPLKVKDLAGTGRGDPMPAILLSARCHERGELHILRAGRWVSDSSELLGTPTQGFAINNTFQQMVGTDYQPKPLPDQSLKGKIASNPQQAKLAYHSAALKTYAWMRKHMTNALREGMLTEELAYYRGIAAREHMMPDGKDLVPEYRLESSHILEVWDAAVKNNDKVMTSFGWRPI